MKKSGKAELFMQFTELLFNARGEMGCTENRVGYGGMRLAGEPEFCYTDTVLKLFHVTKGTGFSMRALITGASSGLGREMAKLLAARGYELILAARREDRLRELAAELPTVCHVIAADVSDATECRLLYESARADDLDVVINNAGFGLFGEFTETDLDDELRMIDTNIRAVHILTKLALRDFTARGHGYILNVASSAGFLPGPLMATYSASKNYVLRLTQGVREELRRRKSAVRICALCPGPVNTEFNRVANVRFALPGLQADRVAREAIDGLFAGKAVVVPGAAMKAMTFGRHLVSDSMLARITGHFQGKKLKK